MSAPITGLVRFRQFQIDMLPGVDGKPDAHCLNISLRVEGDAMAISQALSALVVGETMVEIRKQTEPEKAETPESENDL